MKYAYLILTLFLTTYVSAEIQQITLEWNPKSCTKSCAEKLRKQLDQIYGANRPSVNMQSGTASFSWKPKIPFSMNLINTAVRMSGVRLENMRIKVRGTIVYSRRGYDLISSGDRIRFVIDYPESRESQLSQAERDKKEITLQGELYDRPLQIVLDS